MNLLKKHIKIQNYIFKFNKYYHSSQFETENAEIFKNIKDWWDPEGSMRTLHFYNDFRIKYIKNELNKEGKLNKSLNIPFEGLKFLDIGCGGGLLSESIARLGGKVTGIDPNITSYNVAINHLNNYQGEELNYMNKKIEYFNGTIEEYKSNCETKYNIITAMEVIEHVEDPRLFIHNLTEFLEKEGYLFISTINKTTLSYITAILIAEKITGIIPAGTHEWEKFIPCEELEKILLDNNYELKNISGVSYNILTSYIDYTDNRNINYIITAKKNI